MGSRCVFRGVAVLVALWCGTALAEPEPWLLGDDGDRVAVVAARPGEEAAHCAGLLQECAGLDVPVQVFFLSGNARDRDNAALAAEEFGLSPDACDFLAGADELSALLAAFMPTHVVVASPGNETLAALELAFPDPGRAPVVLLPVPPGDPEAALALTLPPYQLDARASAAAIYSRAAPRGDTENYATLEIDDLAEVELTPGGEEPDESEYSGYSEYSEGAGKEVAPAPPPAAPAGGALLRPRTRLPSQPKPKDKPKAKAKSKPAPSSWGAGWDEPVCW